MADVFTPDKRSWIMSKISGFNTKPEIAVRKLLFRLGYRFRLHQKKLPGNPDIVLPRFRAAIFVHGCFWHGHHGCNRSKLPSTNLEFWKKKIAGNTERDRINQEKLSLLGWRILILWSCEIRRIDSLEKKLKEFLPNA